MKVLTPMLLSVFLPEAAALRDMAFEHGDSLEQHRAGMQESEGTWHPTKEEGRSCCAMQNQAESTSITSFCRLRTKGPGACKLVLGFPTDGPDAMCFAELDRQREAHPGRFDYGGGKIPKQCPEPVNELLANTHCCANPAITDFCVILPRYAEGPEFEFEHEQPPPPPPGACASVEGGFSVKLDWVPEEALTRLGDIAKGCSPSSGKPCKEIDVKEETDVKEEVGVKEKLQQHLAKDDLTCCTNGGRTEFCTSSGKGDCVGIGGGLTTKISAVPEEASTTQLAAIFDGCFTKSSVECTENVVSIDRLHEVELMLVQDSGTCCTDAGKANFCYLPTKGDCSIVKGGPYFQVKALPKGTSSTEVETVLNGCLLKSAKPCDTGSTMTLTAERSGAIQATIGFSAAGALVAAFI